MEAGQQRAQNVQEARRPINNLRRTDAGLKFAQVGYLLAAHLPHPAVFPAAGEPMERGGITILSWASQNVIVVSVLVCDRDLAPVENPGAAHAKAPIIERAPVPVLIARSKASRCSSEVVIVRQAKPLSLKLKGPFQN